MTSAHGTLAIDGLSVHVETRGRGTPLLLLHGFTGTARSMGALGERLARDFRVIAPDLPGHGRSSAPRDLACYRIERCVEMLAELLDVLGAAPAHVLGYSMGGRVALALCARHPQRVRAAVLIGASAGLADPVARDVRRAADDRLAAAILRDGVPAFVDAWARHPLFATQEQRLSAAERDALRAERLLAQSVGLANALRGMGTGAQPPRHDALPALRVPTLWLAGADDPKFQAIGRDLSARMPDAAFAVVPGAGHAAHLENPAAVARLARRHLRDDDAARSRLMNPTPAQGGARW